jgi:hypothetical protein
MVASVWRGYLYVISAASSPRNVLVPMAHTYQQVGCVERHGRPDAKISEQGCRGEEWRTLKLTTTLGCGLSTNAVPSDVARGAFL